ncbi:MAG: Crp/Fnr family transcriptional regulator [Bacteroidota bacterium]
MENIRTAITEMSGATPESTDEILAHLRPIHLEKGDFLLQAGQICRRYFFIETGAVRLYYYREAQDFTVWIGTPGQIFTDLESYLDGVPSRIWIEAIEPSVVFTIDRTASDALAAQSNAYNTTLRRTVEIAFVSLSRNVMSFQSESATDRYQRLAQEKDWLRQYPLRYISSFIGITQSTLSRIRARRR